MLYCYVIALYCYSLYDHFLNVYTGLQTLFPEFTAIETQTLANTQLKMLFVLNVVALLPQQQKTDVAAFATIMQTS